MSNMDLNVHVNCLYICKFVLFMELYFGFDVAIAYIKNDYVIDQMKNLTIPCGEKPLEHSPAMWVREGKKEHHLQEIQVNGSLVLTNVSSSDSGLYICSALSLSSNETDSYEEIVRVNVRVRTTPGPVSFFTARASTIIAVIIWEACNNTGGYAVRDFTAEFRPLPDFYDYNETKYEAWERLDPHHISPNARQLEIYHLQPNSSYEFRIWANNKLGAGEMVTITATTKTVVEEKDLIRRMMIDGKDFDTRVWLAAVVVVMGSLLILSLGTCILLYKECHETTVVVEDELADSLELVPNIILNPGFEDDRPASPPMPRIFRNSFDDPFDYDSFDEPRWKRKMSVFFQGNTIKRNVI